MKKNQPMENIKFFKTQSDFRKWLEKNHNKKEELWVGFYKKSTGLKSITWPESVDEAICFGWIDGIRKSIDAKSYKIRFTPRKTSSYWSKKNLNRANELIKLGLIHSSGLKLLKDYDVDKTEKYSYEREKMELSYEYENEFRKNKTAWKYFQNQTPYYKKTSVIWVMSAKRLETQKRRLSTLINDSENFKKIGILDNTRYSN